MSASISIKTTLKEKHLIRLFEIWKRRQIIPENFCMTFTKSDKIGICFPTIASKVFNDPDFNENLSNNWLILPMSKSKFIKFLIESIY